MRAQRLLHATARAFGALTLLGCATDRLAEAEELYRSWNMNRATYCDVAEQCSPGDCFDDFFLLVPPRQACFDAMSDELFDAHQAWVTCMSDAVAAEIRCFEPCNDQPCSQAACPDWWASFEDTPLQCQPEGVFDIMPDL